MDPNTANMLEEQKKNCPFCKIIKGEIPSKKIFESNQINKEIIGILDINPASQGHALIMPKEHYPIMPLIPQETADELFINATRIAEVERVLFTKEGTTIFIANGGAAGQQSSHFMVHVIAHNSNELKNFNFNIKPNNKEKFNELHKMLAHNVPLMLRNAYKRFPLLDEKGNELPQNQKNSKEHIIKIIDANQQLKDAILKQPEELLKAIPQNNQLKELFNNIDPKEIIKHYLPDWEEKKEEIKKNNVVNKNNIDDNKESKEIKDINKVINYIKNNKRLMEFILEKTDEFKKQLPQSEKMKEIFKNFDINEIISILKKEKTSDNNKNDETDSIKDKNNLDLVSGLFK
jgi:histidine triad (HIT) family protein